MVNQFFHLFAEPMRTPRSLEIPPPPTLRRFFLSKTPADRLGEPTEQSNGRDAVPEYNLSVERSGRSMGKLLRKGHRTRQNQRGKKLHPIGSTL